MRERYTVDPRANLKDSNNIGQQCLLARRLVERGVPFVTVNNTGWDNHLDLATYANRHPGDPRSASHALIPGLDKAMSALIGDLSDRGMLDETLVIWTGEFGRLPTAEGKAATGRGHNPNGFTLLLAGGGLKGGYVHGATDEFGYAATEDRVGVPDLMATVLNQLGLDHERLTFNVHATNETLTDAKVTGARVVRDLFG